MRNTFINKEHQLEFEENGYILVKSFLDKTAIQDLSEFYENIKEKDVKGFHATMHSLDFKLRKEVTQKIYSFFCKQAGSILDNYRALVGNYTVKEPGRASFFDFHLDWNMLDERKARSITIWVPLVDTSKVNGNLWILEKSHKLNDTYRCGPGLNLFSKNKNEFFTNKFSKIEIPMQAGDAIIYDHKLFHASPPNLSNQKRVAINMAMLPLEIKSVHYFYENDKINIYEVADGFYNECLTHKRMEMTGQKKIGFVENDYDLLNQEIVNHLIE